MKKFLKISLWWLLLYIIPTCMTGEIKPWNWPQPLNGFIGFIMMVGTIMLWVYYEFFDDKKAK